MKYVYPLSIFDNLVIGSVYNFTQRSKKHILVINFFGEIAERIQKFKLLFYYTASSSYYDTFCLYLLCVCTYGIKLYICETIIIIIILNTQKCLSIQKKKKNGGDKGVVKC